MKKDKIIYKDFIGTVHFSTDDELFYGKIEGINYLVTFEGVSVKELRLAFEEAVDDYLGLCADMKKEPFKSFKGSFNVRISPDLHKKAYRFAVEEGVSLNQFIQLAVEHEINQKQYVH